jgi:pyruvate dehydrogenase E2 component (dihydrolipoamide acetyltransferase)
MAEFRMPSLGADMTEGTLLQWLAHPGDTVHKGDVIAEVDTTKAAIEIECFEDGVLGEILVPEGRTVPVGTALTTIEPVAATTVSVPAGSPPPPATAPGLAATPVPLSRTEIHDHHPEVRATPLIRRLAAEAGLDLTTLHGSGPDGRIMRADVEAAAGHRDTVQPAKEPGGAVAHAGGAEPKAPRARSRQSGSRGRGVDGERAPRTVRRGRVAREGNAAPKRSDTTQPAPARTAPWARASGYARRLAETSGIDLAAVPGTGPGGAVRAGDVLAASRPARDREAPVPGAAAHGVASMAAPEVTATAPARDLTAMRTQIAAAMTRSKQTVPHYYLSETIDVTAASDWLRARNAELPVPERILMPALLFRAVARAARKIPQVNGHWVDGELREAAAVHLGIVVSLRGGGIILPAIPDADTLGVPAMMAAVRGVVARARSGRLRSSDVTPATITVTNLGDLGVDSVFGVIAMPQVAIVGFGAVTERPCAVGGLLGVRPQLTATLSADHRASDGATGARFLHAVSDLLQQPEEL